MLTFNPEIPELKKVVQTNQTHPIYIQIHTINLTSLNTEYTYEIGTNYKNELITQILTLNKKNLLYHKIQSGKILSISKKPIDSKIKKQLQTESETFLQSSKRYFYIHEISITKNTQNLQDLLTENLQKEIYLTQKKENIQKQLTQIQTQQEIENYNQLWEKTNQNHKTIKINLNKLSPKEILKYAKHSYYLTQSLYNYYKTPKNEIESLNFALAYKIWFTTQKLLLKIHKIEKINAIIENRKPSESHNEEKNFKIQNKYILDWFNATIKTLYPHFSKHQIKQATQIENQIKTLTKKTTNQLIQTIHQFINQIEIKGFQSMSIDNFQPSETSKQFITRQIYLQYKPETKLKLKNLIELYYSSPHLKKEYKSFTIGDTDPIYQNTKLLNHPIIKQQQDLYSHFGFLEIDFFNAFNSYFFPNDSDKYYKQILDTIFEIANSHIIKTPNLFKTLTIGILGDEFFFLFLTKQPLTKQELKTIHKFLLLIQKEILKQTKNKLLIHTGKKQIIDTKDNEITIRIPLEKTNPLTTPKLEIGKISISKYLSINKKINYEPQNNSEFKIYFNNLDYQIKKIKKAKFKKIKIDNFLEK